MIYILLAAALVVLIMGQTNDGAIIVAVLFFNAIIGTIQEGRANKTLSALKRIVETTAAVVRDNKEILIPSQKVVPGDVILLQEGERIPADSRVLTSNDLALDEAALTGESFPVHKTEKSSKEIRLPISDQKNMVFAGTHIISGNGKALVVGTGRQTALGSISEKISKLETEIPLKREVATLARAIILVVGLVSGLIFTFGIISGKPIREMFTTVVSLSVSVIPEGLPIVMTLVLATGVWRMSKKNALVKRLQAVEALGQARIIAVDKTGTLTKNEMLVERLFVNGKLFHITGSGYDPQGAILLEEKSGNKSVVIPETPEVIVAAEAAALTSGARVYYSDEEKKYMVSGDPTDAALLVLAEKAGLKRDELLRLHPKIQEIPFTFRNKYHAARYRMDGKELLIAVGAPEIILRKSKSIWRGNLELASNGKSSLQMTKSETLEKKEKEYLEEKLSELSAQGFRVIAFAVHEFLTTRKKSDTLPPLTFVGFYCMRDSLRPEVSQALEQAKQAGIKVVMITGDHKITAEAIAKEVGILSPQDRTLTGEEMDSLNQIELKKALANTSVFARVTPEHKLRIIQAYRERNEIVAMTGDGVNDAPSLVAADLGVAMGKIGTEVAKEASDIVLLDDNFGSIISAIEEGRGIYKTIKKVILYLFSTSLGEIFTIAGALVLTLPLPILPAQIIWLNFVTDGFLDVALAMEPKEKNLLRGNFERPKKYLVDKLMAKRMIIMAIPMMIGALALFYLYQDNLLKAWTMSLTVLAVFQWFNAWNCRSESNSIFQMNPFSNLYLVAATITVIILQLAAVYHPFFQKILHTTPLVASDWIKIIIIASSIIAVEEIRKIFYRLNNKDNV